MLYIQTSAPLKKVGNKILCMGFVSCETKYENEINRSVCCVYDIQNKSIKYILITPNIIQSIIGEDVLPIECHYLGEMELPIDVNFYIDNSFVSKEGLNIQVLPINRRNLLAW